MAFLTIGIPFYNAQKYLEYAILSVINQTYNDWILLLVNDGSSDKSLDIALKYSNDERITVISDGINKGLIYRLNQITSLCNTKYLARMDADDIMHPYRIEKQILFLEINSAVDIVGSYAYSIDQNNYISGILTVKSTPNNLLCVFKHDCFIHPSIIGRTNWFKNNQYNQNYFRMEDEELWARTILKSSFANMAEPLLFYREVGISCLNKYIQSTKGDRILIRDTYQYFSCQRNILLLKSYLKSFLYIIFSIFHAQNYLIKKRSNVLDVKSKISAKEWLNKSVNAIYK